jgi:hypothetical protein
MAHELVITDSAGVRAVADAISLWTIDRRQLVVRMPGLDTGANDDLARRIRAHFGACGCHQGRVAGMFTFVAYLGLVLTGVISVHALGLWRVVGLYFAVSFVVMFVGKVIGLRNARQALRRLARELDAAQG